MSSFNWLCKVCPFWDLLWEGPGTLWLFSLPFSHGSSCLEWGEHVTSELTAGAKNVYLQAQQPSLGFRFTNQQPHSQKEEGTHTRACLKKTIYELLLWNNYLSIIYLSIIYLSSISSVYLSFVYVIYLPICIHHQSIYHLSIFSLSLGMGLLLTEYIHLQHHWMLPNGPPDNCVHLQQHNRALLAPSHHHHLILSNFLFFPFHSDVT